MKGLLKGIQSVLVAMAVLCMIGTGVILWFNKNGGNQDVASQTETEAETAVSDGETMDTESAFPEAIPVSTVSENTAPVISATASNGHTHSYTPTVVKDATCTEAGMMRYQCSCGDFYTESIATLEHKAGDWTTIQAATTTSTGLRQQKCVRCGALLKEEVIPRVATSSTSTSSTTKTDSKKKDSKEEDNHVHSFVGEVTTEPTCIKDGVMTYTCTCDSSYTAAIPATGHPSRKTMVTEATCTEPGTVICSCAICGAVISQDSTPALGHHFGKWVVTTAPTKTEVGKYTRTCTRCDETEEKDIPKTTDPTSTHQHAYAMEVTKEPSCTEDGLYTYTCSCGETYTEEIRAYGHSASNWIVIRPATETENGLRQKVCRRCGEEMASEEITYTASHTHDFGSGPVTTRAATCTSPGYLTYMCRTCGYTYTTELDMLEHRFYNGVCTVCGAAETD